MAYQPIQYSKGGFSTMRKQIEELTKRANAIGGLEVKTGSKLSYEVSDTNAILTIPDISIGDVTALQSAVAALEADLATAEATIAELEEAATEAADVAAGNRFEHTLTHIGDVRITAGSNDSLQTLSWSKILKVWQNAPGDTGFYMTAAPGLYRQWAMTAIYGGSPTLSTTFNIQTSMQIVGPSATQTASFLNTGTRSGNFNTTTLGLTTVGATATVQLAITASGDNSGNSTNGSTAYFTVGSLTCTVATPRTFIWTPSGGATTRDDSDGA